MKRLVPRGLTLRCRDRAARRRPCCSATLSRHGMRQQQSARRTPIRVVTPGDFLLRCLAAADAAAANDHRRSELREAEYNRAHASATRHKSVCRTERQPPCLQAQQESERQRLTTSAAVPMPVLAPVTMTTLPAKLGEPRYRPPEARRRTSAIVASAQMMNQIRLRQPAYQNPTDDSTSVPSALHEHGAHQNYAIANSCLVRVFGALAEPRSDAHSMACVRHPKQRSISINAAAEGRRNCEPK